MKKTLLLVLVAFVAPLSAQEYIFGKVVSEDDRELADVTVVNIITQQTSTTNSDGNFMIYAKAGDEIRFTRERYTRISRRINAQNISRSFSIVLEKIPQEIELVEIKYQLTGDLKKDADHFGKTKKILKLEADLGTYMTQKAAPGLLDAKPGEFVQPVGPGFSVGRSTAKWNDIDLNNDLKKSLPPEFFTEDLKLQPAEIQTFIFFVLKNFEREDILKYGTCSSADYARFQQAAFAKISAYKNNLSNDPKNKKMKLRLKDRAEKI